MKIGVDLLSVSRFTRIAEHHRYRVMVIENVVDVATQPKYRLAWHTWRQDLMNLGYRFRVISLNSMHAQAFGPHMSHDSIGSNLSLRDEKIEVNPFSNDHRFCLLD